MRRIAMLKKWVLRATLGLCITVAMLLCLAVLLPESIQVPLKHRCLPRAEFRTQVGWLAIAAAVWTIPHHKSKEECIRIQVDQADGKRTLYAVSQIYLYAFDEGFLGVWKFKSKSFYVSD